MHGTFNDIATAPVIDVSFAQFIGQLYADGTLPPVMVVRDCDDYRETFKRTGSIAVLSEDETEECSAFGNWGTYYAFIGWVNYRDLTQGGNEFQLMVADVVNNVAWSPETAKWIGIINALVVVQEAYADKFGQYPVNLNKFIKSYLTDGEDMVLSEDRY